MVSATTKDKNWFLPIQIRLIIIWLLELELVSFLGKNIFGNCRPSSKVKGVLSAELQNPQMVVRAQ